MCLILLADLRSAIGFSSFGVLLYYLIANVAAYTQSPDRRRFPRIMQLIGVAGCGTLVLTLPMSAVLGGTLVFAVGIIYRAIRVRVRRSRPARAPRTERRGARRRHGPDTNPAGSDREGQLSDLLVIDLYAPLLARTQP